MLYICLKLTHNAGSMQAPDREQPLYDGTDDPEVEMIDAEGEKLGTVASRLDRDTDSFFLSFENKFESQSKKKKLNTRITFQFIQQCLDDDDDQNRLSTMNASAGQQTNTVADMLGQQNVNASEEVQNESEFS